MELDAHIADVSFSRDAVTFELADERKVTCPLMWFPILRVASRDDREAFEIAGDERAVEWPDLGERVSIEAILLVRFPPQS